MSSDESYAACDKYIPVQDNDKPAESGIDETTADTDAQLGRRISTLILAGNIR